jgi:PKD repeat protein
MGLDTTALRRFLLVPTVPLALLLPAMPNGPKQAVAAAEPSPASASRLFQGPASGVGGRPATASVFSIGPAVKAAAGVSASIHEHEVPRVKDPSDLPPPLAPAGSNEIQDISRYLPERQLTGHPQDRAVSDPIVSFPAISDTGRIPPDPIIAAGPGHLIAAVNSDFAIFDKSGTLLSQTSADTWFANVLSNISDLGGTFDPQVVYDPVAGRWILAYLVADGKTESWVLLSVSHTADPTGQWCNIPLHGDLNGSTSSDSWSDYPGLGLDGQALYITTNQFQNNPAGDGGFVYSKIRIIPKSELYGPCISPSYTDFWDLTDPASTTNRVFTVQPAFTFGTPGVEYLVDNSDFETSTYFTLWSLTNPLSQTPSLTAQNIPVTASTAPPNADQFGGTGGTSNCLAPCLIDTGEGRLLGAVYRNGSVWATHIVAGGTGNAFARVRYVRIGVGGQPTVLEDVSFGADDCWYYYPAVATDRNSNLAMVFTRSCTSEYAGVRYTGRTTADTTLQPSALIKAGEANYLNPSSGTKSKNRWGDYSGAAVDPTDSTKIWLLGEYAAAPADTWGTWVAEVAVLPSPLTAAFDFSPANPQVGQLVQFTDTSTGSPSSWFWDFDDSTTATAQNPTHVYTAPGTFTVLLTATSAAGSSATSRSLSVASADLGRGHLSPIPVRGTLPPLSGRH